MRAALQGGGLGELFSAVVTGDDVSRGRPDPEPYLLAAQQLGRPPVRCVIIGNSNQVCKETMLLCELAAAVGETRVLQGVYVGGWHCQEGGCAKRLGA